MKQAILFGGLLALALVGSYVTWTAEDTEEERKATDVLVYRAAEGELASITWEEEDRTVRLVQKKDAGGSYLWVEQTDRTKVKPPKAEPEAAEPEAPAEGEPAAEAPVEGAAPVEGEPAAEPAAAEAPEAPAEIKSETTQFTGNDQASEVWKAFSPMYALRELAVTPETDLAAFGLDAPKTTITVELAGRTVKLELGGEAFGTRDRYLRAEGRVFLVDDAAIRPVQFAKSRLVERRLQPLEEKDIRTIKVTRGADTRTFVQKNADDRTKSFWADGNTPDARDVEASTWLGKLFRLRVKGYVDEATAPALVPVFSFEVVGPEATWTVEVSKAEVEGAITWYARPSFTRALVDLTKSVADEAIDDLPTLFDGVTPPPEEGEAEPAAPVEEAAPTGEVVGPQPG